MTSMAMVNIDQAPNERYSKTEPKDEGLVNPALNTMFHKTSESSAKKI